VAYLNHIVEASTRIRNYTAGMSEEDFLRSPITRDAVIRNLEIIGEACHNVLRHHPAFAASHAEVPWRSPYEMRNALTHGYFGVDLVSTWTTIVRDLPDFDSRIQALLPALR
jgi:uncharacterized protein with HEPN domain